MFTGIIEQSGKVQKRTPRGLAFSVSTAMIRALKLGESVSVNGACLTVAKIDKNGRVFSADVMPETWKRTALGELDKGTQVNLERAMQSTGRFGGHFVQGHVDDTAILKSIKENVDSRTLAFKVAPAIAAYLAPKGSIAINGISLTIIDVKNTVFSVGIIPHTWKETNMKDLRVGERVNIEVDIIAKYVRTFLQKK